MKAYVITLERSKERNEYIRKHVKEHQLDYQIISAVDGKLLTEKDIQEKCNSEKVSEMKWWLTNGAIGCALSHIHAYEAFLKTSEKAVLIIEDDIVLPSNIHEIIAEIESIIQEDEIIQLHYASAKPAKLSTVGGVELPVGNLYYPMNLMETITTGAYMIGRKAAEGILRVNTPIESTSDSWHIFHDKGAYDHFRVLYPMAFDSKNFKSSIDYIKQSSLKAKVRDFVEKFKVPIVYQLLISMRNSRKNNMRNYSLTDEVSPIYQKTQTPISY
jgi:glycosyl transferase, family 25